MTRNNDAFNRSFGYPQALLHRFTSQFSHAKALHEIILHQGKDQFIFTAGRHKVYIMKVPLTHKFKLKSTAVNKIWAELAKKLRSNFLQGFGKKTFCTIKKA